MGYPAFLKVPLKRHIVKCYCAIRMLQEILNILFKYDSLYENNFQKYNVTQKLEFHEIYNVNEKINSDFVVFM